MALGQSDQVLHFLLIGSYHSVLYFGWQCNSRLAYAAMRSDRELYCPSLDHNRLHFSRHCRPGSDCDDGLSDLELHCLHMT